MPAHSACDAGLRLSCVNQSVVSQKFLKSALVESEALANSSHSLQSE